MSRTRSTTLGEYSNGVPEFDQLVNNPNTAPQSVVTALTENIARFQTAVELNNSDGPYLVGDVEKPRQSPDYCRLYHYPKSDNVGLAGTLRWKRHITPREEPNEYTVGFAPATEQAVYAVDNLDVEKHDRSERLADLLPAIRSELTGLDWTGAQDPRPSVDDWHTAANKLSEFAAADKDRQYPFPPADIARNKPIYVLARWSSPAVDSLVHGKTALLDRDDGVETVTPEAFRELLFDYASANGLRPV